MPLPGMDLHQNVERGAHRKRENDRLVKDSMKMTPLQNDVWVPTILAVNGMCVAGGLHFVCCRRRDRVDERQILRHARDDRTGGSARAGRVAASGLPTPCG